MICFCPQVFQDRNELNDVLAMHKLSSRTSKPESQAEPQDQSQMQEEETELRTVEMAVAEYDQNEGAILELDGNGEVAVEESARMGENAIIMEYEPQVATPDGEIVLEPVQEIPQEIAVKKELDPQSFPVGSQIDLLASASEMVQRQDEMKEKGVIAAKQTQMQDLSPDQKEKENASATAAGNPVVDATGMKLKEMKTESGEGDNVVVGRRSHRAIKRKDFGDSFVTSVKKKMREAEKVIPQKGSLMSKSSVRKTSEEEHEKTNDRKELLNESANTIEKTTEGVDSDPTENVQEEKYAEKEETTAKQDESGELSETELYAGEFTEEEEYEVEDRVLELAEASENMDEVRESTDDKVQQAATVRKLKEGEKSAIPESLRSNIRVVQTYPRVQPKSASPTLTPRLQLKNQKEKREYKLMYCLDSTCFCGLGRTR